MHAKQTQSIRGLFHDGYCAPTVSMGASKRRGQPPSRRTSAEREKRELAKERQGERQGERRERAMLGGLAQTSWGSPRAFILNLVLWRSPWRSPWGPGDSSLSLG